VREAFYGSTRFDEFENALGIAPNTLSSRLKALTAGGLFERRLYSEKPPRYQYVLTEKGRDLRPVLLTLLQWGNKHSKAPGSAVQLIDTVTGKPVELKVVDNVTGEVISARHRVSRRIPNGKTVQSYAFPDNTRH
jgi:DNA-binding HxlR family transcriptional regulator